MKRRLIQEHGRLLAPPNQWSALVDRFIQRENLALFKKRLGEPHTAAEHEILLKLVALEEAKLQPEVNNHGTAPVVLR